MKLYIVRHGETDWNGTKQLQGWTDMPLNTRGVEQAKKLKAQILAKRLDFDYCYSSPLKRVLETAKIVTDGKMEIRQDALLKERSFGTAEGRILNSWDELEEDIFDETLNSNIYGIEPIRDFQRRVELFLGKLRQKHTEDKKILIVTSGGTIKRALYTLTGDRQFISQDFHIKNCVLREIEI